MDASNQNERYTHRARAHTHTHTHSHTHTRTFAHTSTHTHTHTHTHSHIHNILTDHQKRRVSKLVVDAMFNTINSKKIAVLGFAFKADTGDTREEL